MALENEDILFEFIRTLHFQLLVALTIMTVADSKVVYKRKSKYTEGSIMVEVSIFFTSWFFNHCLKKKSAWNHIFISTHVDK